MCPVRCSSFAPRRAAGAAALSALLLAGCRVNAAVTIEAESDGTGDVTAVVTLDQAAAAEVGSLEENVRVDDLRDAGWIVIVGERTITATKSYDHPDEASTVLQEVGGPLVPRARVTREAGFAKTTTDVEVELDLTKGLQGFADAALEERLGGLPGGFDPNNMQLRLAAEAPGEAAVSADVPLGQRAAVSTSGTDWHVTRLIAAAAAPILAVAAAALFWRRRTVPVPVTPDP
jgi:hypothetical protein